MSEPGQMIGEAYAHCNPVECFSFFCEATIPLSEGNAISSWFDLLG